MPARGRVFSSKPYSLRNPAMDQYGESQDSLLCLSLGRDSMVVGYYGGPAFLCGPGFKFTVKFHQFDDVVNRSCIFEEGGVSIVAEVSIPLGCRRVRCQMRLRIMYSRDATTSGFFSPHHTWHLSVIYGVRLTRICSGKVRLHLDRDC